MSVDSVIDMTLRSFLEFTDLAAQADECGLRLEAGQEPCLADYIEEWIRRGHGVYASQGNFERHLIGIAGVIEYWTRRPDKTLSPLNCKPEDVVLVSSIFQEGDRERKILDRDFYEFWTYQYRNRDQD